MARIRSVHPGQATDEDFLELSVEAKLATILIRCEADDNGVFEWKPKTLKARLFPADDVDMASILSEMEANRQVASYELEGRKYGVIRNFRRYQRPKKPNSVYPFPERFRKYAGFKDDDSPTGDEPDGDNATTVPQQYGTTSEFPPQMEDEGGRREEVEASSLRSEEPAPAEEPPAKAKPAIGDLKAEDFLAYAEKHAPCVEVARELEKFRNWSRQNGKRHKDAAAGFRNWLIKAEEMARERGARPPARANGAAHAAADPLEAARRYTADWPPIRWDRLVGGFKDRPTYWLDEAGPKPNEPGCIAPREILAAHGFGSDAAPRAGEAEGTP